MRRILLAVVVFSVLGSGAPRAELTVASTFNPSGAAGLCGLGFDPVLGGVWVFGCSAATVQRYGPTGVFASEVARPGESANDVDVELAPEALTLNATALPIGSLLFINGETGPAEIYAVDKTSAAVLATLPSAFGVSHVVGGAYHPGRNTFFLVQDNVPGAADENRIAEVDAATGSVLNTFQITATFSVNFGDLEVCGNSGNLLVASDDETSIAEYTPTGTFVQYHALPVGVSALSGLGVDDLTGDLWVGNTVGNVWRLQGDACAPAAEIATLPHNAALALAALLLTGVLIALRKRVA